MTYYSLYPSIQTPRQAEEAQPTSGMALLGPLTNSIDPQRASSPSTASKANAEDVTLSQSSKIEDFQERYNISTPSNSTGKTHNMNVTNMSTTVSKYAAVLDASTDDEVTAPLELSKRGIHIPTRTSSTSKKVRRARQREPSSSVPTTPESRERSSAESVKSYDTNASSLGSVLPPLQAKSNIEEAERLEPLIEDDPQSFSLLSPSDGGGGSYSLERRSVQLFSTDHLKAIFADPSSLLKFTSFLSTYRPDSISILIYYLDALKALRVINYANAVAEALEPIEGYEFTTHPPRATVNSVIEDKANQAFDALVRNDLPAFISHTYVQIVSLSIHKKITGTLAPHLREASEGLAEVFCLSDPSRPDNPIVFASEEFHRTTQYGVNYAIGRNCRFLQGPRTDPISIKRMREAVAAGKDHHEVFLNYRRDGSPFMNLLMIAPLYDSRGIIRYYIGAQVDVSGLVKEGTDLEAYQRLMAKQEVSGIDDDDDSKKDEFLELSQMFNSAELETVRLHGGSMHREQADDAEDNNSVTWHRPRLLLKEQSNEMQKPYNISSKSRGQLEGVYQHYLLLRPYPSLRILFTSPSLRVPGILQSPFMDRIGGSPRVREELVTALAEGRGVTAKIRWISHSDDEGRSRWIHCTPLLGSSGNVGVWMVVLIDDEQSHVTRRFRKAPPVATMIGKPSSDKVDRLTTHSQSVIGSTLYQTPPGSRGKSRPPTAMAPKSLSLSSQLSFNVEN